ncbi:cytosolic carboxypeptidase 2-like [Protopterus annectens]|uniref:cytosolic carboxypeptidase 2-like n=1 Tax=Protopterus annectens TaxID=7888 RepID=UPI001CF9A1BF|nr:cytosolic carboxypeptidase 2-like [Protopterus annectens]
MGPALKQDRENQPPSDAYDVFMQQHLQHYGFFSGQKRAQFNRFLPLWNCETNHGYFLQGVDGLENRLSDGGLENRDSDGEEDRKPTYKISSKTKQLLFNYLEGKYIPRLCEPRSLYAVPTSGPLQPPRWPIECEVIKEKVHHIEWIPNEPEKFYQPTGYERTPHVVGEERKRVVFFVDPATKGSYFNCSRVGGCRGPIKQAAVRLNGTEDDPLLFESRFESGNLQKVVQVGRYDYELTLRTDLYTNKHTQWYYFRVQNMKAGVLYRFTIVNFMKSNSLYNLGMKPLMYSEREVQTRNVGWQRVGSGIKYYKNSVTDEGRSLYSMTWTFQFPHDDDTCYFSHCYPYTYSDLQSYLLNVANNAVLSQFCKVRVLCRSLAGNMVYILTITSPSQNPYMATAKKGVVVTARIHPGETTGSWMMKGFLDFILGDSADAHLLRKMFVFKVVPMLNPDGVIVGNYRCSLAGRDLNRNYQTLLKDAFPCVWHTKNMIRRLIEERDVVLYCDLHGHSRKNNVFMYGCSNKKQPVTLMERVFPLMLSKNAANKFSYKSCKFKVQKNKEGTGRIVMWRMGIPNSYTMESTFSGSSLGDRKGTHFSTRDLTFMGQHFCDTLLDFCDPDQSKVIQCLEELQEMVQQEIRLKLEKLGHSLVSEEDLKNISLSDFESSTSGSDSSESDGLPAHLLSIAEKLKEKKKSLRTRKERNRLLHRVHQNNKQQRHQGESKESATPPSDKKAMLLSTSWKRQIGDRKKEKEKMNSRVLTGSSGTVSWATLPCSETSFNSKENYMDSKVKQNDYLEAITAAYLKSNVLATSNELPKGVPQLQYSQGRMEAGWHAMPLITTYQVLHIRYWKT